MLGKGATFHSLQHESPARIDFYRARVVDGLGQVVHERLFAVEIPEDGEPRLQEPGLLGNFAPADPPAEMPAVAALPEATTWLHEHALAPFLEETRKDRLSEVERVSAHVELSLTELLQRADEEIGRAAADVEQKLPGAEGRLAQAETRHAELLARRERRRIDLDRQRALTLQAVERLASVLVLPHPEREAPEVRRLKPNFETEATAMRVVMEHEQAQGRQVYDVSEKNLGYDVTSLDLASGELRLIEVKGLGAATGTILLTPNERRVAEDRPRLLLALRRHRLRQCAATPGADPRPGAPRLERGDEGGALLPGGERDDEADAGARGLAALRREIVTSKDPIAKAMALPAGAVFHRCALQVNPHHYAAHLPREGRWRGCQRPRAGHRRQGRRRLASPCLPSPITTT